MLKICCFRPADGTQLAPHAAAERAARSAQVEPERQSRRQAARAALYAQQQEPESPAEPTEQDLIEPGLYPGTQPDVTQQQQVQRDLQHLFNRILKGYAPAEAAIADLRAKGVRIGKHVVRQLKGIKLRDLHTHLHALSHTKLFIKAYLGHAPPPPKQLLKLLQAWGVHVDLPEVPTGPVGRWGQVGSGKAKGTVAKGKVSGAGGLARAGSATPAASAGQAGEQQGAAGSEDEAGSEAQQQAGSAVKQEAEEPAAGAAAGTPAPAGSITPAATLPAPRSSASGSAPPKSVASAPYSKGLSTAALAAARQAVDRKIVESAERHMAGLQPAEPGTLRLLVQVSAGPVCMPTDSHCCPGAWPWRAPSTA
jgi:hypothetical protein